MQKLYCFIGDRIKCAIESVVAVCCDDAAEVQHLAKGKRSFLHQLAVASVNLKVWDI